MEDLYIKEIEKFDNQLIKDYMIKIRTEIFNGLEDLIKRNDKIYEILVFEESTLLNNLKNNFINIDVDNSEEVKKLTKLIKIYSYLRGIFSNNRLSNLIFNNLKSLIKE